MYRAGKKKPLSPIKGNVHLLQEDLREDLDDFGIYAMSTKSSKAIIVKPYVDGVPFSMELDTGSAVSVISQEDYVKYFPGKSLNNSRVILKTYSGEEIIPKGVMNVSVKYNNQKENVELFVPKGGPPLFGREWLRHFQLNWKEIKSLKVQELKTNPQLKKIAEEYETSNPNLQKLIMEFQDLFGDGIGLLTQKKATLSVKPQSVPKFVKARPIPFAMHPKVEAELDKLEKDGIISRIESSDWASPIVPILKSNSKN